MSESNPLIASHPMLRILAHNWRLLLVRGLLGILFGLLAIFWPQITLRALVILFGLYVLADGITSLFAAAAGKRESVPLWWLILGGIVSIAAGVVTFLYPAVTELVLILFIGAWALVRGLFEVIGAVYLRKEIENEWLLIGAGLLSVLFGLAVMLAPGAGALALIWVIGGYALLFGAALVWLALRLRKQVHRAD